MLHMGVVLRLWITIVCVVFSSELQSKKRRATKLQTIPIVKKYLVGDAARLAKDGAAPELGQDDPLREKRHTRGTADTNIYKSGALLCG